MRRPWMMLLFALIQVQSVFAQVRQTAPPSLADRLSKEVEGLKTEVASLKKRISDLNSRILRVQIAQQAFKEVELDPASPKKYQRLDTDNGFFLFSFEEAVPYLDGVKVKIEIGNPSAATYTGFSLNARWGQRYDWEKYSEASYEKWEKSIKEKEVSFTDHLRPGTWNKIELILAQTKPEDFGFLQLTMQASTISLRYQ